tara:strand:+ start:97 stop:339 length:243 start_codon:yes stop_codon:yes gene_type:complete
MSIDKELQKDLSECLKKIDSLRSQLEDLNWDLRELWGEDAFDFEDSIWGIEDACTTIENALEHHETPLYEVLTIPSNNAA